MVEFYRRGCFLGVVRVDDGSLCDGQRGAGGSQEVVSQYSREGKSSLRALKSAKKSAGRPAVQALLP